MVVRIKTGKRIQGALSYNERKVTAGKAELILASRFGAELHAIGFSEKLARFRMLTSLNQYVKSNTLHLSLNFSPNDQLNREKMQAIAQDYMKQIGFGDQPFLVYLHKDTRHPHLHIVTTNIQQNGRPINMFRLAVRKSEHARKDIEQVFHLIPAESMRNELSTPIRPIDIAAALYSQEETKRQISNIVKGVTSQYHFTNLEELNDILRVYNVQADPGLPGSRQQQHHGLVYHLINRQGGQEGVAIKASSIDTKPTMKFLERKFTMGVVLREQHVEPVKEKLTKLLSQLPGMPVDLFLRLLAKARIDVTVYKDQYGKTAGLKLVDHKARVSVTTEELGISINELQNCLHQPLSLRVENKHADQKQGTLSNQQKNSTTSPAIELLENLLTAQQTSGGMSHGKRSRKRRKSKPG